MPAELREALEQAVTAAEVPASDAPTPSAPPAAEAAPATSESGGLLGSPAPASDKPAGQTDQAAPPAAPDGQTTGQTPPADDSTAPQSDAASAESRRSRVDRPPAAWRGNAKAKWAEVPLEARQEVHRRESMADQAIAVSQSARQFQQQFAQVVSPFMARIQSNGYQNPVEAIHQMLKIDYTLSSAPMPQRAKAMAQLIKDYGIDFTELDRALVTDGAPPDPVEARVAQIVEQRLAPVQQFLSQQQRHSQAMEIAERNEARTTVEQMEQDTQNFPDFETVRDDMADLIEIQARRGVYLSPAEAYTRAVAMNPELSSRVQAQVSQQQTRQHAASANAQAQRALNASVSVGGAPTQGGVGPRQPNGADLRGTISAAFEQATNRI